MAQTNSSHSAGTVAKLRGARLSAQKGRLVADLIRGKNVSEAMDILTFSPKKGAALIRKVLQSAIANAAHNSHEDIDQLSVLSVYVERGTFLRRFMARARGRGFRIHKPTCHIYLSVGVPASRRKSAGRRRPATMASATAQA